MTLLERLNDEIKAAMLAKNSARLSSLRLMKSELMKAEVDQGKELSAEGAIKILNRMVKQRRDSIEQFRAASRNDLADKDEAEMKVIESFLPAPISMEQIDKVIDETLAEIGPVSSNTTTGMLMGRVMGKLKATGLSFEARAVSDRILQRLQ